MLSLRSEPSLQLFSFSASFTGKIGRTLSSTAGIPYLSFLSSTPILGNQLLFVGSPPSQPQKPHESRTSFGVFPGAWLQVRLFNID